MGRITLQQASALASFISAQNTPPPWLSQGSLNAVINSWHLLSRWAAQLRSTLSASAATEVAANTRLLSQAVTHACRLLVACRHGVISGTAVGLVGSLVLFLGNASYGGSSPYKKMCDIDCIRRLSHIRLCLCPTTQPH